MRYIIISAILLVSMIRPAAAFNYTHSAISNPDCPQATVEATAISTDDGYGSRLSALERRVGGIEKAQRRHGRELRDLRNEFRVTKDHTIDKLNEHTELLQAYGLRISSLDDYVKALFLILCIGLLVGGLYVIFRRPPQQRPAGQGGNNP